jgi:hypothetical protein
MIGRNPDGDTVFFSGCIGVALGIVGIRSGMI